MYITIVAALTVAGFPECKISRGAVSVLTGLDGLREIGVGHERRAPCAMLPGARERRWRTTRSYQGEIKGSYPSSRNRCAITS